MNDTSVAVLLSTTNNTVLLLDLNFTTKTTVQSNLTTDFDIIIDFAQKKSPLINNAVKRVLEFIFQISLFFVTSVFGIVVNVINIIIYRKQGLGESITLGFFVLSISDLFVVACPLAISACYMAKFMLPNSLINFVGFHYVSTGRLRQMAFSFSNLVTAFLSLERCCCVILPFKVKIIFTRNRTLFIITALLVFHTCCYLPLFATHQLRWMEDPKRNYTKTLRVWFAPKRQVIEKFNFTLMAIITPTVSQIIVICSSVIMIGGLRASSKFRQIATGAASGKDESASSLSSRDARLVKAMVFLGVILSVCNMPYLVLKYAMLLEPELNIGRAYHNTYSFISSITFVLASVNASVNVFVYYNTSSRYQQIFKAMFSCRRNYDTKTNE